MILLIFIAKHLYKKSKIYCRVNELYLNFIYRTSLIESNQCDFAIIEEFEKILSENVVCK